APSGPRAPCGCRSFPTFQAADRTFSPPVSTRSISRLLTVEKASSTFVDSGSSAAGCCRCCHRAAIGRAEHIRRGGRKGSRGRRVFLQERREKKEAGGRWQPKRGETCPDGKRGLSTWRAQEGQRAAATPESVYSPGGRFPSRFHDPVRSSADQGRNLGELP